MRLLLASTLIVLVGLAPALTGAEELGRDRLPVFQIDAADGTAISFGEGMTGQPFCCFGRPGAPIAATCFRTSNPSVQTMRLVASIFTP